MDFDAIFGRGPRELGTGIVHDLYDFGCPPGIKKESILETASVFFELQNSSDFRAVRLRFF